MHSPAGNLLLFYAHGLVELRSIIAARTVTVLEKRGTPRRGFNRCFSGVCSRKVLRVGTMAETSDDVYLLSRPIILMFVPILRVI